MKRLPFLMLALCAGCAQQADTSLDRSTHVQRVLEDVSAIIEGMAGAHTENRVVVRGPEFRSSLPRPPQ